MEFYMKLPRTKKEFVLFMGIVSIISVNIIAPLMPFFVLTVAFFQKYDKKAGIGSVISTMLPYSLCFLVGWIILFAVWYLLGLPLGPGAPLFYPA